MPVPLANTFRRTLPQQTGPFVETVGPNGEKLTLFLVTVSHVSAAVLLAPTGNDAIEHYYDVWPQDMPTRENAMPLTQAQAEGLAGNWQDFCVDASRDGETTLSSLMAQYRQQVGGALTPPAVDGDPVLCPACTETFLGAPDALVDLGFLNRFCALCPHCFTRLLLIRYQGGVESVDGDHWRAVLFEHPESRQIRSEWGNGGGEKRLVRQDREAMPEAMPKETA